MARKGRVAQAPKCQTAKRFGIGTRIGGTHLHIGAGLGAGIGQAVANAQAQGFGLFIGGGDRGTTDGFDAQDERLSPDQPARRCAAGDLALSESAGSASAAARRKRYAT